MNTRSTYSADDLHRFCCLILEKVGAPTDEARQTADVLLYADIRGIDSHGIAHLSRYARALASGAYSAQRAIAVVRETPSTALIDGGGGLGLPCGVRAMNIAIEKAQQVGSSCVAVRNSHHFGAAGYYAHMALEHDMIGSALTNAGPIVLPTFGLQPQVGTNPIAIAIPADKESPFVLDMATSVKAAGKLEILMREGKMAPTGWLMSSGGDPAQDPEEVLRGRRSEGLGGLLPLGGAGEETSGYKGFGLALAVEMLGPLLAGDRPSPFMEIGGGGPEPTIAHFFAAIRIDAFRPVTEFKRDVDRVLRHIKASPAVPGRDRVYVAGEKEFETLQKRSESGIPLHPKVVEDLQRLGQDFGSAPLEPIAP